LDPTNVPVQQYFHSKTLIPYQGNEWELDSDNEEGDEWRHQLLQEDERIVSHPSPRAPMSNPVPAITRR